VIFELYTAPVLFPLIFDQLDLVVGTIVDTLGQLPPHWEGHFVHQADRPIDPGRKDFWYDPPFKPNRPLERQIAEKWPQISEHRRRLFVRLLSSALCLDPIHRLGAAEIAVHPWLSERDNPKLSQ
jgi:serine/threonine protein kinase